MHVDVGACQGFRDWFHFVTRLPCVFQILFPQAYILRSKLIGLGGGIGKVECCQLTGEAKGVDVRVIVRRCNTFGGVSPCFSLVFKAVVVEVCRLRTPRTGIEEICCYSPEGSLSKLGIIHR